MRKVYHLSTCTTCQRIIKELELDQRGFEFIDIKAQNISEQDLDKAAASVGSYENVFSKRAMKFRALGLQNLNLDEADYKRYILEEYTFLKRPVIFFEDEIFIGNTRNVIALAKTRIHS